MEPVRVGIVGFGRIGAEHAAWLAAARGVEAVAVCDATPARRELAASQGLKVYQTLNDMLEGPAVEAVLISTPTAMHFEPALAALARDKHLMIEKPMAMDRGQAEVIVQEAENRGRVLSVFHNRRWDLDYLTVRAAVQAGTFGRIIDVESRLHQWGSCVGPAAREYRPGWRNEAAYGGGGLYDWGSHFIDQLWRLLWPARPVRVFAQLRGNVWTRDCDDFARVILDYDNGAVGLLEINTTTTRPLPRWHVDGTTGSADSPASAAFDVGTWAKVQWTAANPGAEAALLPVAPEGLTQVQIWEQFALAVRGSGQPAILPRSVLPTMALLDAARESNATGQAVPLRDLEWVY
jgi:predicted dehydrogenase